MTITIKTKNLEFGKQTKLKIEGKLKKIEKLFSSDAAAVVKVAQEKAGYKVEITAPISNRTVRAEVVADDMMAAMRYRRNCCLTQLRGSPLLQVT